MDFGVPSILSILVICAVMRVVFRKELCAAIDCEVKLNLNGNGKLVLTDLAVMVIVLLAAPSLKDLGLPTCLAALAITTVLCIKSRSNPMRLVREMSLGTPILVAGLFVMVEWWKAKELSI
jgi:arsenical pump membrane protein